MDTPKKTEKKPWNDLEHFCRRKSCGSPMVRLDKWTWWCISCKRECEKKFRL